MSFRPSPHAASSSVDADEHGRSVRSLIAAAKVANSAFVEAFGQLDVGSSSRPKEPAPTALRPDLNPGLLRYAKNGPSFLLEALYDSDAAHDYNCNFATVTDWNPNEHPKTKKRIESGLLDCSENGYFMYKNVYASEANWEAELTTREEESAPGSMRTTTYPKLKVAEAIATDQTVKDIEYQRGTKFPLRTPVEDHPKLAKKAPDPDVNNLKDVWEVDPAVDQTNVTFYLRSVYQGLEAGDKAELKAMQGARDGHGMSSVPHAAEKKGPAAKVYAFLRSALRKIPEEIPVSWKEKYKVKQDRKGNWVFKLKTPDKYERTLETYINTICMAPKAASQLPMNSTVPSRLRAQFDGSFAPDGRPIVRTTKDGKTEYPKDPDYPSFHLEDVNSTIFAGSDKLKSNWGFVVELTMWTHWLSLDTSGPTPRGSAFLRYVDWRDAYLKYPQLPIFKPEACNPLLWEEYMSQLRHQKLIKEGDGEEFGEAELDQFFADMHVQYPNRYDTCYPRNKDSPRADGQATADDYLYVILICASGREPVLMPKERMPANGRRGVICPDGQVAVEHPSGKPECEERYTEIRSGFGKAQLDMVDEFAKKLGVQRTVLSALANVVPYYRRTMKYSCCSRHGRDLKYLTDKFELDKRFWKAAPPPILDIYNLYPIGERDLEDPTFKRPTEADKTDYVEEAARLHNIDPSTIQNPPTPYYIAEAIFFNETITMQPDLKRVLPERQTPSITPARVGPPVPGGAFAVGLPPAPAPAPATRQSGRLRRAASSAAP